MAMRITLAIICTALGLFVAGCQEVSKNDAEALRQAVSKIPLPPGAEVVRLDAEDPCKAFSLSANLRNTTSDEVMVFYRDYLESHGWRDNLPPEDPSETMLDFDKGRATVNVTLNSSTGGIYLLILYREYERTHGEFARLVDESASPEALALIRCMADAYGALASYADTGEYVRTRGGRVSSRATFKILYVAPDQLWFEYTDSSRAWFHHKYVMSKLGKTVRTMANYDESPESDDDIASAMEGLYGVTSCTSENVPGLLLRAGSTTLVYLANRRLLEEAELDDGTLCLRLTGTDFGGAETTIWLGKDDLLIRKVESVTDGENRETTTYHPKANVDIDPEELRFRPL